MNGKKPKKQKNVEEYMQQEKKNYVWQNQKKIFVLFHVQNEKFRGKNTKKLFYFCIPQTKTFRFEFQEFITNF